ncbi:Bifunctional heparan sulfate N-deacetylase/N-sulfotransferase 3 [Hondaea fermentalgiana]|uniref:Bifunctional heparan sulfate N-deacetylase/N-sulfotransferase 3 n=1 Tax=Hondaea fermentalgiana TaxID=2315210 RepID=A0A2R5GU98_9STRA|nr:Bifunctional heparan sulfate N-deacetylase/N-sulfotransferase 3 [Hondaea fermentalgiana]|eukprot:GBG33899.1 Bifunctional heparan sulfate N-deacetylase/N-sulfotransferase 3 [Hondaea fermentalgiana]
MTSGEWVVLAGIVIAVALGTVLLTPISGNGSGDNGDAGDVRGVSIMLDAQLVADEHVDDEDTSVEGGTPNVYGDHFSTYHCRLNKRPGSLPSFMVIGVHKGGSTALYGYLAKHGHIRPAKCKETLFFESQSRWKKGLDYYQRLFPKTNSTPGIITGEGTPGYIRRPVAVVRISETVPHAKFIVSFRDPVERFISHFVGFNKKNRIIGTCMGHFSELREKLDACVDNYKPEEHVPILTDLNGETAWDALQRFADPSMLAETLNGKIAPSRANQSTCNVHDAQCKRRYCFGIKEHMESAIGRSVYVDQLVRWLRFFPPDQILIIQSEAMYKDVPGTLNLVAQFLGLRPFTDDEIVSFSRTNTGSNHHGMQLSETCDRPTLGQFFAPENELLEAVVKAQFPDAFARWMPWQR